MHIHGSISNIQGAGFYGVSNGERAAAAQRAAETRKRLLKAGQNGSDDLSPEETALIGHWLDARHSQVLGEDEYRAAASGRDPDFG
jgi:hypothetical protein